MNKLILPVLAVAALALSSANSQIINDATGDIDPGITTGGGTLDIVKMEVSTTATDVTFALTVNGNTSTTDWGKFMVGIATGGTGTTSGNGWGRPINLDSPIGGMNYWIGSWVDAGGGAQLWSYNGTGWDELTSLAPSFTLTAGAQSLISISMPLSSIGITSPTLIYFDAYSSGGGGGDSAIDALSNPNIAVTSWGGPYTSDNTTGISSATVPEPSTYALFAMGALALGGYAARRRARK